MKALCVTGPLGAGKTTTLVQLLAASDRETLDGLHLVVNEVGDFQVDVERMREDLGSEIDIDSLTAGCLGCENAAEFDEIVGLLAGQEGLLAIEPTGVADAREIKAITDRYDLPWSCLTLVNPETFRRNRLEGMLAAQLSVATMVGITWLDGLNDEVEDELMAYIAEYAGGVPIMRMEADNVLPFKISDVLADVADHSIHYDGHDHDHEHNHGGHGHFTTAFVLKPQVTIESLNEVLAPIRDQVVRAKGVVQGLRFDLVGSRIRLGSETQLEPHVVIIATEPINSWLFANIQAEPPHLPDKRQLMVSGRGTLEELIEAVKLHAGSYPEPFDSRGFPRLGAESDIAGWLARSSGVPIEVKQAAMTARMCFLLGAVDALRRAEIDGLYIDNPKRLAREQLELGAALAWNAGEKPEEMTSSLVDAIVSVKPAHLAIAGLGALPSLGLELLPDDSQGPTTPRAILAIVRFGFEREGLSREAVTAAMRHAVALSKGHPIWHHRWLSAFNDVRII